MLFGSARLFNKRLTNFDAELCGLSVTKEAYFLVCTRETYFLVCPREEERETKVVAGNSPTPLLYEQTDKMGAL